MHERRALEGLSAIVTGSGRNIGKAIGIAFAKAGAKVTVNGHKDRAAVDAIVDEIREGGGEAIGVMADVGVPDDVKRLVAESEAAHGSIDIAVSNVAVRRKQPFLEITADDWHSTLNSNLASAFYLAQAVLPCMQRKRFGRLIHISGVDGFAGHLEHRAHNIVCKAGVHALAKALSVEFAPFGITANSVVPGHIDTERDWSQYPPKEEWMASRKAHLPVRRFGTTGDVAQACVYLAGESGAFVTGQALHVNGGQFMY